ncbi:MAG: hypothetical protein JNK85_12615 [Verrucomicrobiales bacterium]|nr:hypothetical protein [Verrucomicrobiales bacterium]
MNTPTLVMNLSLPPIHAPASRFRSAPQRRVTNQKSPVETSSPTLDLARACAREASAGETVETASLLFFGACAATLMVGCGFQIERFLAQWDSFQNFVRAILG